jgi:polynucleotide 5'-kinase involved in rRNA processing
MKRKRLSMFVCVSAILSALIAQIALAADWKEYFENTKSVKFYIDKSSVVRLENGNVQAWQKREKEVGDGFLYLMEVNCKERKYIIRTVSTVKKTVENIKLTTSLLDSYKEWIPFEPNEFDEDTYSVWCQREKQK